MRLSTTSFRRQLCLFGALLAFSVPGAAVAQAKKSNGSSSGKLEVKSLEAPPPAAAPTSDGTKSDKLDISDLEQKYWSPKDTDFGVVQNRTYTKEKRFSLSLLFGPVVNDVFNEGNTLGVVGNYYFSERHGIELFYLDSNLGDSDATKRFKQQLSGGAVAPDFGRVTQYIGVGYNFVPIYAKMSFLGRKIVYFDMAVTPGVGMTTYEQQADGTPRGPQEQTAFTYSLDITQYFFFSRHIALRFDLRNRWFTEEILKYSDGTKLRDKTTNTTMFLFGVSYFF